MYSLIASGNNSRKRSSRLKLVRVGSSSASSSRQQQKWVMRVTMMNW